MRSSVSIFRRRVFRPVVRHIFVWIVLPVIAILILRLYWGHHADQRLQSLRQQLHDKGLKVYPTDYPDDSAIPYAQNGVNDLQEATMLAGRLPRGVNSLPALRKDSSGRLDIARTPQESADLQALYAAYLPAMTKVDDALSRPQLVWPQPKSLYYRNSSNYAVNSFSSSLSNLLCQMALLAHGEHDDAQALLQLRRVWGLSRALGKSPNLQEPSLAIRVDDMALSALEGLSPELDLRSPAAAAQAHQLLAQLQDDSWYQRESIWQFQVRILQEFQQPIRLDSRSSWLLIPLVSDQLARTIKGQVADANSEWMLAQSSVPKSSYSTMISVARCRAVSVLLATRLYTASHGTPPDNASALVPDYLPQPPLDPFLPAGQPLHYRLLNGAVTVWSVGPNSIDDFSTAAAKSDDLVFGAGHFIVKPLVIRP